MDTRIPRVSIGMPVFNGARWLPAAIDALLAQTFGDFELIISDNRSSDDSWRICQEYSMRDPRIRIVQNEQHVGAFENFNIVFRLSRAPYFKWASCNDLCAPAYLERCVKVLDQRPDVVLSYPRTRLIDSEGAVIEDYEDRLHLDSDSPVTRCKEYFARVRLNNVEQGLIRRSVLAKSMLQRNFIANDCLLMAELTLYGKFHEVPEYLFSRRMGAEATTKFRTAAQVAEFFGPGGKGLSGQTWRRFAAHAGMIFRAPLSFREKLQLWRQHGAMIRWSIEKSSVGLRKSLRQLGSRSRARTH